MSRPVSKRIRLVILMVLVVGGFFLGAFQTREAVAVGPCDSWCTDPAHCWQKCACYTPEWGIKVTFCTQCPWAPGNVCTL